MVPVLSVILLVIMEIIKICLKHQPNHLVSLLVIFCDEYVKEIIKKKKSCSLFDVTAKMQ